MQSILSVIAPHSGSGKTTFVVHLLRRVKGLSCLKISPTYDSPEGTSDGHATIEDNFFYLEDHDRLDRPGKDTALYAAAGAVQAGRLRHRGDGLAPGIEAALARFDPGASIVVESSRAVPLLKPAAVVLVVRPPIREMKPATEAVLSRVTDLLVNTGGGDAGSAEADALRQRYSALRPPHTWAANLISEPPPEEMLARLQTLLL